MYKKCINIFGAFILACSCFLMPLNAAQKIEVTVEPTEEVNTAELSIDYLNNVNAFSINLKLEGSARLTSFVPSQQLVEQGARVNFVAKEQEVDLYITAKKALVSKGKLSIGTMKFDGKANDQVNFKINPDKSGLKIVSNDIGSIVKDINTKFIPITITGPQIPGEELPPVEEPVNLEDQATGIKLSAQSGILPNNTQMKASKVADQDVLSNIGNKLSEISTKFTVFDIHLEADGVSVQPKDGAMVEVRMPIPKGYNKDKLAVYYVGDEVEIFQFEIKDSQVVFLTNHFSHYVIAEKNVTNTPSTPVEPSKPGDGNQNGGTQNGGQGNSSDNTNQNGSQNQGNGNNGNGSSNNQGNQDTGDKTLKGLLLAAFLVSGACIGVLGYKKHINAKHG